MHRLFIAFLATVSTPVFAKSHDDGMLEPIAGFQPLMDVRDYVSSFVEGGTVLSYHRDYRQISI